MRSWPGLHGHPSRARRLHRRRLRLGGAATHRAAQSLGRCRLHRGFDADQWHWSRGTPRRGDPGALESTAPRPLRGAEENLNAILEIRGLAVLGSVQNQTSKSPGQGGKTGALLLGRSPSDPGSSGRGSGSPRPEQVRQRLREEQVRAGWLSFSIS